MNFSLPFHPGRGEGLEAGHHGEAAAPRHPGPAQRPQHQGPGPGGGVHVLLPEQGRVREEGASSGQGHGRRDELDRKYFPH